MSQGLHPRIRSALVLLVLLLPAAAIAGTTPAGQWVGEVKTPDGDKVEILLILDKEGSDWKGSLQDPTMGETQVSNLRVTDTRISFTFKPADAPFPMHFSGSYIAGDDRVTGTFSLHGNSRFVKFKRKPGSEVVNLPEGEEPPEPARIRHDYKFAVTGRVAWWMALHVTKDDFYSINDLTAGTANFDAAAKWFVLDGFNVFARYYRGGHDFTDHRDRIGQFEDIGLTQDAYMKLDGFEFGVMGYVGNLIMRDSKFNPYLTASAGQVSWALQESGRGSAALEQGLYPFEGDALAVGIGLGTEYEVSRKIMLEFEWLWRYFMTEDEDKWDPDTHFSNTHTWALSAGVSFGF